MRHVCIVLSIAVLAASVAALAGAPSGRTGPFPGSYACVKGKTVFGNPGDVWLGCNGHISIRVGTKRFRFSKGVCDRSKKYYRFQAPWRKPARPARFELSVGLLGNPPHRNPDGTYSSATFARNGIPWSFAMLESHGHNVYADQSGAKLIVSHHGHAGVIRGRLRDRKKSLALRGSYTCP
jgi:hypothetical protein